MFERLYYMSWEHIIFIGLAVLGFLVTYACTDDVIKSGIITGAILATGYVILHHVI